jgi:hypothetical protein
VIAIISAILCLACVVQDVSQMSTVRGITGRVRIVTDLGPVHGRPDLDLDSPLLVRIAGVESLGNGRTAYEVEFIGVNAGIFDLRDVLVLGENSSAQALDPIPVEIISRIGGDAPTDVFLASSPPRTIPGGYWQALLVFGIAWILIPLFVLARRMYKSEPEPEAVPPTPTLRERLQPLVDAAAQRRLSISEQGQLELMLYAHWHEQLGLEQDRPSAIAHLRQHVVAGRLLRAVESWLHAPERNPPSREEIESLLDPYREESGGEGS